MLVTTIEPALGTGSLTSWDFGPYPYLFWYKLALNKSTNEKRNGWFPEVATHNNWRISMLQWWQNQLWQIIDFQTPSQTIIYLVWEGGLNAWNNNITIYIYTNMYNVSDIQIRTSGKILCCYFTFQHPCDFELRSRSLKVIWHMKPSSS